MDKRDMDSKDTSNEPKRSPRREHVLAQRPANAVWPGAMAEDGDGSVNEAHDGADGCVSVSKPSQVISYQCFVFVQTYSRP